MKNPKASGRCASLARRRLLTTAAAVPLLSVVKAKSAIAAQFVYKLATTQDPTNAVNIRAKEAIDRIRSASGGRLDIHLFPASQLGSDTDLLSQVRSGSIELCIQAASILSTLVPAVGIANVGFAFRNYDKVWSAMDGALGTYLRAQIEQLGLTVVSRPWDNGFRQVTTSTHSVRSPADLHGLKLRVPPSPMITSLFQALGAGPTPINVNELYSALQTHLVEGQENALTVVYASRIYEVQKYVSLTSHGWDNHWLLANDRALRQLPPDLQAIVRREFDRAALEQRADVASLSESLRTTLKAKGLQFNDVDQNAFLDVLHKTNYYQTWKDRYGASAWNLLEQTTGRLA